MSNFEKKIPSFVSYLIFGVFIIAYVFFKFSYHELWKDEWQAWLMARDMGWVELFKALYYEGHPALWYAYLKLWAYLSDGSNDPVLLQVAHALVMVGVYYLLLLKLRLPWWFKALLLLSYYPFFEYGMVSRGYAFVMLFGFAIVLFLNEAEKHWKALAILFFLFCQTEVYAVMMAGALMFYLFLENRKVLFKKVNDNATTKNTAKNTATKSALLKITASAFLGFLVFIISVFPRGSADDLSRAYLSEPLSSEVFFKGFQGMLVNTFWIGAVPDTNVFGVSGVGLVLSGVVLVGLIYFFKNEKNVLWTLLFFVIGYFVFLVTIYTGGVRQWGTFFIFFILLAHLFFEKNKDKKLDYLQIGLLVSILLFQIRYAFVAVQKEYQHPFSNAKLAAAFVREKIPEQVPIVAINKFEVAPVVGYAHRDFYALPSGDTFTYFKWVEKIYLPPEQELRLFAQFKNVGGIVIIAPKPLGEERYPNAQLWKKIDSYNIKNENYYFYTLSVK
ncbi:MAG: hypothetical protein AAF573_04170 [Bacteroidota bacterium]